MKIIGLGKVTKAEGVVTERRYILDVTEEEFDMITGIAGRPHVSGRYKPGREVNIAGIYQKVKNINEKHAEIKAAAIEVQADAAEIANSIPLSGD